MINIEHEKCSLPNPRDFLKDQLIFDLNRKFELVGDDYKCRQDWEDVTGLNKRTLRRYMNGETTPTGRNILRTYAYIFDLIDLNEVKKRLPEQVIPYYNLTHSSCESKSMSASSIIKKSPIHAKIFLKTMNGNVVDISTMSIKWGAIPVNKAVSDLQACDLLECIEVSLYKRGSKNTDFCPDDMLELSKSIVNNELRKTDLENNALGNILTLDALNLDDTGVTLFEEEVLKFRQAIYQIEKTHNGDNKILATFAATNEQDEVMQ